MTHLGKELTQAQMDKKLAKHRLWSDNAPGGERLVLIGADLRGAYLRGADLQGAHLRCAHLRGADLQSAHLRGADLRYAHLRYAHLRGADLQSADLRYADLRGASLRGADLRGADLDFSCLPLHCGGQFKADGRICKQIAAHLVRIIELSEIKQPSLIVALNAYKKGWHHEDEF